MKKGEETLVAAVEELCRKRVFYGYAAERLSACLEALDARMQSYAKGDVLASKGSRARTVGIIVSGRVLVRTNVVDSKSIRVLLLPARRFVGLPAFMLRRMHYPVTYVADADCTVLWMSAEKLRDWRQDPSSGEFFATMIRQMFEMFDKLTRRCAILGQARLGESEITYLQRQFEEPKLRAVPYSEAVEAAKGVVPSNGTVPAVRDEEDGEPETSAEELWRQAQAMVDDLDPEGAPERYWAYKDLLVAAAEGGCVDALAQLGEQAFQRGDLVEAYFWTKVAGRRLYLTQSGDLDERSEIDAMAREIRRQWLMEECPPEYDNECKSFTAQRGEIGRALLRIDSGIDVRETCAFLQALANEGNLDAALFAFFDAGLTSQFLRRKSKGETVLAKVPFPCGVSQLESALQEFALGGHWRDARVKMDGEGNLIVTH